MADDFPADVRRFIERHIETLAQLELLLLIHSENSRLWTLSEISQALSFPPTMSAELLQSLSAHGFVTEVETCYQYRSIDPESDQLICKLGETYRVRRVAVTNEIYAKPLNRLKSFSDAFRFRKEQ